MGKHVIFSVLLIAVLSISGCQAEPTVAVTVGAAASLSDAFTEIGEQFTQQYPQYRVQFNFAGSQQIAYQALQGAPLDVFASANQRYMDELDQAGMVAESEVQLFAGNELVVIFPTSLRDPLKELTDLARPGLKLVLAAEEVPVGRYALTFLENASKDPGFPSDFKNRVLANVVSYENNVSAVVTKVALGEADAGIVYRSDLRSSNQDALESMTIPKNLNVNARYPIAVLKDSVQSEVAHAFVNFVLSLEGQTILKAYGFTPGE